MFSFATLPRVNIQLALYRNVSELIHFAMYYLPAERIAFWQDRLHLGFIKIQ
jgi:hypothetical protein